MLLLFGFLRPVLSPWAYTNRCFLVALCCLIVRTPNLEVATKRLFHQHLKLVVLVPCCTQKSVPTAISSGSDISEVPGCHFFRQMISQWSSQKLQGLVSHELTVYLLTQWIMAILSKGCKPDNFESHISLKISLMNISGLRSSFVECESFLKPNSPNSYSCNYSVTG